ncbi:MAG TPA: hypothetical protein PLD59_11925 [Tepidisphaeraceae bacterium]|mgnify:CR=1 FL=1|nr:hypothetical protein [Tepidisphaeraceae bacterium]
MPPAFYIDHNFHRRIPLARQKRQIDCLTAQADGRRELEDQMILQRATRRVEWLPL